MSCLSLSELNAADQAAVARACEGFVPRSYADLLTLLASPAAPRSRPSPLSHGSAAGEAISVPSPEHTA